MARRIACEESWEQMGLRANFRAREMARLCDLSLRQLEREFRRRLGRSPQSWLNERRILAAGELLLAGVPIKKLSPDLGFKQVSHFHRQFKCRTGMTPMQFLSRSIATSRGCRSGIQNVARG
jgi:AraC-like DNA-binding protein